MSPSGRPTQSPSPEREARWRGGWDAHGDTLLWSDPPAPVAEGGALSLCKTGDGSSYLAGLWWGLDTRRMLGTVPARGACPVSVT